MLHVDGAEFYTNSEFLVWSLQSVFSSGNDVWDSKFPICVIPHDSMRDPDIKLLTQQTVAKVVAWSLKAASGGTFPAKGPFDECLLGERERLQGQQLAGGFRACFFGMRADGKARKECNFFPRSYQHSLVCEACMAQKQHKGWEPSLSYKNFYPDAAYRLTPISY